MSWKIIDEKIARRSFQTRFIIKTEQLEFGSHAFIEALNKKNDDEELEYGNGFAIELLNAMKDHLSISDLKQIVEVFSTEYEKEENERQKRINGIVTK